MLRYRFNRRRWEERGVVAVVVALSSIVLLTIAALAVDLGNGFARKRDVQNQADFATLAGANELPAFASNPDPNDEAVKEAAQYLLDNQPSDDAGQAYTKAQLITLLTDDLPANGEAYYGHFVGTVLVGNPNELTIVTPPRLVEYGLAKVIGATSASVQASATVGVFSPAARVFPAFAVSGCDQGPQTIVDPSTGHTTDIVPVLNAATDTNIIDLDSPSTTVPNPAPSQIAEDAGAITITIKGNNKLDQATMVGFFKEGNPAPSPVTLPGTTGATIGHPTSTTMTITLPAAGIPGFTDTEGLWWVRVWAPTSNNGPDFAWSAIERGSSLNTLPFRIGTPYLRCDSRSSSGNYGALKLPRTDSNNSTGNGWLPFNMALGLQAPLSLHVFPGDNTGQPYCTTSPAGTIYSPTTGNPTAADLRPGTNCVETDLGLAANSTTQGLITGPTAGVRGSLDAPTTTDCSPAHDSAERTVNLGAGLSKDINNDVLTCFFVNDSVTVGDVSDDSYTGAAQISADIYKSPRFFWQPVLGVPPTGGGNRYKIIDMRPSFLADQPLTATRATPQAAVDNGVTMGTSNQVASLSVIFLNIKAIEQPDGGPVMDWLGGTAPKLLRMVN